jgi:hypothetical protein
MINLSGFSRLESILHKFLKENDKGNKLRIDNLLYELKKLPKLSEFTAGYDWFNLGTLLELVQNYFKIYDNIKKIDKNEHNVIVTSFVSELTNILKKKVLATFGSIGSLIKDYNSLVSTIINPYFSDYYNTSEYPEFLTNQVITMINEEFSNVLTVDSIVNNLNILTQINMFNKETLEKVFEIIVSNIRCQNSIKFVINDNITQLTHLLEDCSKQDVSLSELLRFLIINRLGSIEGDLFIKGLIYKKYGELLICNYITKFYISTPTIKQIIRGLKSEDLKSEDYELDMFYLNYEMENNKINFVNKPENVV